MESITVLSSPSGLLLLVWCITLVELGWTVLQLIIVLGMGPIVALKYYRFVYRPSAINVLQQIEHLQSFPRLDSGSFESPLGFLREEVITRLPNQKCAELGSVHEPLLHDSPSTSLKRTLNFAPEQSPSCPSRSTLSAYARSKNKWHPVNLVLAIGWDRVYHCKEFTKELLLNRRTDQKLLHHEVSVVQALPLESLCWGFR